MSRRDRMAILWGAVIVVVLLLATRWDLDLSPVHLVRSLLTPQAQMSVQTHFAYGSLYMMSTDEYFYDNCVLSTQDGAKYGPLEIRGNTRMPGVVGSPASLECHLRQDRFGEWQGGIFRWP